MTPELINAITLYTDEVVGLTKEHGVIGGRIEQKVSITEHCWGTVDAMLWNKDTLYIIDLKMGKGVEVEVEDNPQLKIYSIGGLKYLHENFKMRMNKIVNIIIQPRVGTPVKTIEYSIDDLATWGKEVLLPIVSKYRPNVKPDTPPVPSDKACRWCEVKATCTARAKRHLNHAVEAFAPFTDVKPPVIAEDTSALNVSKLAELKKYFKGIQAWMKDIDDYLYDEAMKGTYIEGYKLVEGRANRRWGVDEALVVPFLSSLNVEPYEKKLISPTQAEKTMGKKMARDKGLETYVIKPKGKPSLVDASDKRPTLILNAEEEFKEFATPEVADTGLQPEEIQTATSGNPEPKTKMSVMERMRNMDFDDDDNETPILSEPKEVKRKLM